MCSPAQCGAHGPPENDGNKCLVQAGCAGAVCRAEEFACLGQRGAGFAWQNCSQAICASSLLAQGFSAVFP